MQSENKQNTTGKKQGLQKIYERAYLYCTSVLKEKEKSTYLKGRTHTQPGKLEVDISGFFPFPPVIFQNKGVFCKLSMLLFFSYKINIWDKNY